MKTLTLFAALLAGGFTAASGVGHVAQAHQSGSRTVAIHYGDLDLGSAAGRATLDLRIGQAVRTACGEASPADLAGQNIVSQCRDDLVDSLTSQREAALAGAGQSGRPQTLIARR